MPCDLEGALVIEHDADFYGSDQFRIAAKDALGTTRKHALPLLARSGKGSIVNVSSIRGQVAGTNVAAYSASKAGVRLFTKSTAVECAAARNGVRAKIVRKHSAGPGPDP